MLILYYDCLFKDSAVFQKFVAIASLELQTGLTLLGDLMFDTVGNPDNNQDAVALTSIFIPSTITTIIGMLALNLINFNYILSF